MLLWADQILSQVSYSMLNFALIIWVFHLSGSNTAVSFLILAMFIPSILLSVFAGLVADYFDRRSIMMTIDLTWAAVVLGYLVISDRLIWVLLLTFVVSAINQFFIPAEAATVPSFVKEEEIIVANSLFTFTVYVGMIVGYILTGPVISLFGWQAPFVIAFFATTLAAGFVFFLPPCRSHAAPQNGYTVRSFTRLTVAEIKVGWDFIRTHPVIFVPILLLGGLQAMVGIVSTLLPGFIELVLRVDATNASYIVMMPAGAGMILGALLIGGFARNLSRSVLVSRAVILGGIIFLLIAFSPVIANFIAHHVLTLGYLPRPAPVAWVLSLSGILFILSFLLGFSNVGVAVPASTLLQENSPAELRGRVFGVLNMIIFFAGSVPLLLIGPMADIFGIIPILMAVGLMLVVAGLILVRFWQSSVANNREAIGENRASQTHAG